MRRVRTTRIQVELNVKTLLVALCVIASVWLLIRLWPVLLVLAAALMLVGMVNPIVEYLETKKIKRGWAVAICFLTGFLAIGGLLALTVPSLFAQVANIGDRLPQMQHEAVDHLEQWHLDPLAKSVRGVKTNELVDNAQKAGLAYSTRAIEIVAYVVSAVFLAIYLLLDRDRMRGALFAFVPRDYHVRLSRILIQLETIVGGYMRGQLVTSALMVVFTFVVLTVARVPNAIALAVFAGLADVLPYVGALLACGPAFLAALERGPTTAFVVLAVLAVYQEFESRVIIPRVYGRVLRLPASVVMLALLVGAKLLGIVGALLALPIAAAVRMMIIELRVALPGEQPESPELIAKDAAAEAEYERLAAHAPATVAAAIATEIAQERQEEDPEAPIPTSLTPSRHLP